MQYKAETLKGYKLASLDGEIGTVKEFYFDDQHWTIRYLVAETGTWLKGRQVLISPFALVAVHVETQNIIIDLTKKQIEDSPSLETDQPVSRQFEEAYYGYYGWPMYWSGPYLWGSYTNITRDREMPREMTRREKAWDPHLRSTRDVIGHHLQAKDGGIGHVEDFILDEENWTIRYLVVDTRNWWAGKKVLISPRWIERVSWDDRKVFVNLTREAIQQSPEYEDAALLTREYESELHRHYHRKSYWMDEAALTELHH